MFTDPCEYWLKDASPSCFRAHWVSLWVSNLPSNIQVKNHQYTGQEPSICRSGAIFICKSTNFKPDKCQCLSRLVERNNFLRNVHVPQLQGTKEPQSWDNRPIQ